MKRIFQSGLLIISIGLSIHLSYAQVKVGDEAPKFKARDDRGKTWNITKYLGKKNIVLYFYPAAMTGGCTKQACAYRDDKAKLDAMDAIIVGVSGDKVNNLTIFKEVYDLNFPLLADENGAIAEAYGVPVNDGGSIEREYNGGPVTLIRTVTTARWTFIIDKKGKIAYINRQVDAAEDSRNVIAVLEKL